MIGRRRRWFRRLPVWLLAIAGALGPGEVCAQGFTEVAAAAGLGYVQLGGGTLTAGGDESVPLMSGGAAAADYDGDGWTDLFVTRYDDSDLLFRNLGDGTFAEVSVAAGITVVAPTNGAAWGDIDNDGDADLFVSTAEIPVPGRYYLYVNQGDGTFLEEAASRGAALPATLGHHGFSISFGDFDRDGWIDAHTSEWSPPVTGTPPSRLLRNIGATAPGSFIDVTAAAGVEMLFGPEQRQHVFTSRFVDLDGDRWPELVTAGDFGTSRLFWNNRDGTFTDGTLAAGVGTDENGMGLAVGDSDGDGRPDIFVTSIFDGADTCATVPCFWGATGNRLFLNDGDRTFTDATTAAGVRDGDWGWGAAFLDYDNDGDLDLTMTNGIRFPGTNLDDPFVNDVSRLWRNEAGVFTEVGATLGITDAESGKGLLTFDYDRDGDLDVFIVNNSGAPLLYRNDLSTGNHWLRVRVEGQFSNRDGLGALVRVIPGGGRPTQFREVQGGSHYLGQSERVCHFGLGNFTGPVDRVVVRWPSGCLQLVDDVAVDSVLTLVEPSAVYPAWRKLQFTDVEIGDPGISGILADPDQDGRVNLLEFASATNARQPGDAPALAAAIVSDGGMQMIELRFRRRMFPGEVAVTVETSVDGGTWTGWQTNFDVLAEVANADGESETLTLRSKTPVSTGSPRFFRIRATL